jgi:hypothetical protein
MSTAGAYTAGRWSADELNALDTMQNLCNCGDLSKVSDALADHFGVNRSCTQIRERLRRHVFDQSAGSTLVTNADKNHEICGKDQIECHSFRNGSTAQAPVVHPHFCLAVTKAGNQCKNKTTKSSGKCHLHDKSHVVTVSKANGSVQKLEEEGFIHSETESSFAGPSYKTKIESSLKFVVAKDGCKQTARECRTQREDVEDDQVVTGGYKWERWRTLSGPLPVSGSEAVYEFALSDDRNKTRTVVYCGKTAGKEGIHGRMSAYRSCGSHLEKKRGLFSEAVNHGFTVFYRWQNCETDKAREIELILLRKYDYAWNEKDNKHFRDVVHESTQRASL